jgi:hypothetical protein
MIRQRVMAFILACATAAWTVASLGCGGGGSEGPPACATDNVAAISGTWLFSDATLKESSCPSDVNDGVLGPLIGCQYDIEVSGGTNVTVSGSGDANCVQFTGSVNAGNFVAANGSVTFQDVTSGCTVDCKTNFSGDLGCSPTTAQITAPCSVSGGANCSGSCSLTAWLTFTQQNENVVVRSRLASLLR